MRIKYENREIINSRKVYLHDSYFKTINYDDENKILYVVCQDYYYKKIKYLTFYNVIYWEMHNGYYWGQSDSSIIEWQLAEDNVGLKRLEQLYKDNNGDVSKLNQHKYIESVFISSDGNQFRVICEEIDYKEERMPINRNVLENKEFEMLDYHNDREIQTEGIVLGKQTDDISLFFFPFLLKEKKEVWENCATIICDNDDSKLAPFLEIMLDWIQNMEYPGALQIYHKLENFSWEHLKNLLQNKIDDALEEEDYVWTLWLADLLKDQIEKEKVIEKVKKLDSRYQILDMLDWKKTEEEQQKGIELGKQEKNFDIFIQPFTLQYNKNVWDGCAKIVCTKSDEEIEKFLPALLMWIQDLNWPGATKIMERLEKIPHNMLNKYLQDAIREANDKKDSSWLYWLKELNSNGE